MSTAAVWLRADLRLDDHPALHRAASSGDRLLVVYVLDPRLLRGRAASPTRTAFLLGCLRALDADLRERGHALTIREGRPEDVLPALGADTVTWTSDVSGFARARDARVTTVLRERGIEAIPCPGTYIADPSRLRTRDSEPFHVFTPFFHAWSDAPRRAQHEAPPHLPPPPDGIDHGTIPAGPADLGVTGEPVAEPIAQPGERAAQEALASWLEDGIDHYADRQDGMSRKGTSRLSPHLRFGTLSPLRLEQHCLRRDTKGARSWRRQLCWRDFYAHLLLRFPDAPNTELQPRRRTLRWVEDPDGLAAWKAGRTGFPLVDAGMRELAATGWMHNRVRLVVGSFLTKDLGIDWRVGERHFSALLLDGEPAQNAGNWQWIASVGADPQPPFKRIFNPLLQARKFDAQGEYVRRWVPELRDVPAEHIVEPWDHAPDYPRPILDHLEARRAALDRFAQT